MRLGQPNQSQSVKKMLALFLLATICLVLSGCHLWYQDMKGYLEYWTGTVSIGNVSWSASPASQKDASGVDTISTNASITATVDIVNPDGYPLDGRIGSASDAIRSMRISGEAGAAALAKASVTSSSLTGMKVEIDSFSQVPTPDSLALEHKSFTVHVTPTRSDNGVSVPNSRSLTFQYNTPPRMPLEVVEDGGSLKFLDGSKRWEVVTNSSQTALNDLIFWAWPSGIADSTHPDYVAKFEVYEDDVRLGEYPPEDCLMSGQSNLQPHVPQDLKGAGYDIYCSPASTGKEITIYAVDSEGVRSLPATSGRTPHAITLDANGGTFGNGGDSVTVYRADGASLSGGDLDIPTMSGHYLSGWTIGGNQVTFPYTVSAGLTFTAQWTANPSSGGGSVPVVPPAADPNSFYVNPSSGDDSNTGTQASPLKTIQAAVDKIVAANDGTSAYTILLMGDVLDSSSGAYDSGKNSSLVNIAPPANLNLTIKSNIDGTTRTINAARSSTSTGRVMYVGANASVTLQDVVVTGGNLGNEDGGGVYVDSGGIFIMNDGIISDNFAGFDGGGVYVSQNATFIMRGGSIKANEVGAGAGNFSGGGGVYVNGGTFTMEDGEITQNNGLKYGGGVCVISGTLSMSGGEISSNTVTGDGGGVYVGEDNSSGSLGGAEFVFSDGTISGNTATTKGGGIYISVNATLTMTGGTIEQNSSPLGGVGVHTDDATSTVNMGGSAVIAQNNDILLNTGTVITITSPLTGSSPVATISPFNYNVGTQVLAAGQGVTLTNEVGKFAVVPDPTGSGSYVVAVDSSNPSSGVLTNGAVTTGAEAASQIASLTGNCTLRITEALTAEQITNIKTALDDNIYTNVSLDLSGVALPSNAIPQDSFKDCSNLVGITLPDSVTEISEAAFYGCTGLTSIVIPDSVRTIGDTAFMYCGNLALVRMEATTPPELGSSVFEQNAGLQIQVPAGSLSDYQAAPTWQGYAGYLAGY